MMKLKKILKKICSFLCLLFLAILAIGLVGNVSSKFDSIYNLIKLNGGRIMGNIYRLFDGVWNMGVG